MESGPRIGESKFIFKLKFNMVEDYYTLKLH